jgi:hypothetical protein
LEEWIFPEESEPPKGANTPRRTKRNHANQRIENRQKVTKEA